MPRKYNTKKKTKKRNNLRTNRKNLRTNSKNKIRKRRIKNKQRGGVLITSATLTALIPLIKASVIPKLGGLLKYGLKHVSDSKCKAYVESIQDSEYSMENIEGCDQLSTKIIKDTSHIMKTKGAKPFIQLLLNNLKKEFKKEHLEMNNIHDIKEFFKDILMNKSVLRILQTWVVTLIEAEKLSNKEILDDNNEDFKSSIVKELYKKTKDIFTKKNFKEIEDISMAYDKALQAVRD